MKESTQEQYQKKEITVRYFAGLREKRGLESELVHTTAQTAIELYQELSLKYGFTAPANTIRFAARGQIVPSGIYLQSGMELVIMPPFAGG